MGSPPLWAAWLGLSLGVRLAWLAVAALGWHDQIEPGRFGHLDALGRGYRVTDWQALDIWCRWDAFFYQAIATEGYGSERLLLRGAFFPLFPLLAGSLARLLHIVPIWALLLLGNLCDVAAWGLLLRRWHRLLPPGWAVLGLLCFAAFPSRNFGFSAYSEGLFLLLSLLCWEAWECRAWTAAGLWAALLSATRPQGILLVAALGLDALVMGYKTRRAAPLLAAALGCSGLLLYMVFLHQRFGDPLLFLHLQQQWRRSLSLPTTTLLAHGEPLNHLVLWAAGALWLAMLRQGAPRLACAYVGLSLLVPLLTGSVQSTPRFVGMLFPLWTFALRQAATASPTARRWRFYLPVAVAFSLLMAFKLGQGGRVV